MPRASSVWLLVLGLCIATLIAGGKTDDFGGVDGMLTSELGLTDITEGSYNSNARAKRLETERKRAELEKKRNDAMYHKSADLDYAVVIDCGSTKNVGYVFSWPERTAKTIKKVQYLDVKSLATLTETRPSIADSTDPIALIEPILEEALDVVPASRQSRTLLFLRATGKVRKMDKGRLSSLLNQLRSACGTYPFKFNWSWASTLRSNETAVYSWLSANFLEKNIQHNKDDKAVIGFGSQSLKYCVSAPDERKPLSYRSAGYNLTLSGSELQLYANSWQDLGYDSSLDALRYIVAKQAVDGGATGSGGNDTSIVVEFPCFYMGYTDPKLVDIDGKLVRLQGNAKTGEACMHLIMDNLDFNKVKPSDKSGSTGIPVLGKKPLYAVDGFYYIARDLDVAGQQTLNDFFSALQQDCRHDWAFVSQATGENAELEHVAKRCYGAVYAYVLFHHVMGITMTEKKIWFLKNLEESEMGWPHGLVVYYSDLQPLPVTYDAESAGGSVNWPVWIFLCCVLGVVVFMVIALLIVIDKMNKLSAGKVQPVGYVPSRYENGQVWDDDDGGEEDDPLMYKQ